MTITSSYTTKEPRPVREYPYMGITECGLIVGFSEKECGTVVSPGASKHARFAYLDDWDERSFQPICGTVTLTQEKLP